MKGRREANQQTLKGEHNMDNNPRLSFGAKTLILEVTNDSMTRRDFIEKNLIVAGGGLLFSIVLPILQKNNANAADCSCFTACYTNCHSDCGRKTW
jgi:hypothetical protein